MLDQIAGFFASGGNMIWLLIVFVIFMVVAFKVFKIIMRTITIAIIAAIFPFVARFVFGMNIPITIDSVLWFVITAIALYFIYFIARGGYKLIHFAFGGKKKK
ncbi:MAG: hypothetical protein GXO64_03460 [Candidatus Micrarchaeota archaeon]|nr:hypothetical protein [Candidatus Micrarchaeota archaeon]